MVENRGLPRPKGHLPYLPSKFLYCIIFCFGIDYLTESYSPFDKVSGLVTVPKIKYYTEQLLFYRPYLLDGVLLILRNV